MRYTREGYIDISYVMGKGAVFNYLLTGRGTGKTFGALQWAADNDVRILFLRRRQVQLDMVTSDAFNPYKPINDLRGDNLEYRFVRAGKGVIELRIFGPDEEGKMMPVSGPRGYAASLSGVQNLKGMAVNDIDLIIFDECVPLDTEREVRFEDASFRRLYETVSRNRELQGREPVRCLFLGNANDNLACDLLLQSGVSAVVSRMIKKGLEEDINQELSRGVWYLQSTPITERKRRTALYRYSSDEFVEESLSNRVGRDTDRIRSRDLRHYRPWVSIGGVCIYRRKSAEPGLYVSTHFSGSPESYPYTKEGLARFKLRALEIKSLIWRGRVEYESVLCEMIIHKIVGS